MYYEPNCNETNFNSTDTARDLQSINITLWDDIYTLKDENAVDDIDDYVCTNAYTTTEGSGSGSGSDSSAPSTFTTVLTNAKLSFFGAFIACLFCY